MATKNDEDNEALAADATYNPNRSQTADATFEPNTPTDGTMPAPAASTPNHRSDSRDHTGGTPNASTIPRTSSLAALSVTNTRGSNTSTPTSVTFGTDPLTAGAGENTFSSHS